MSNPAVRRIQGDLRELRQNPTREYSAAPTEESLFEWHFTLRGPRGSDFQGGLYHGRISLPSQWPFKPPAIMLLTPSGRFEARNRRRFFSASLPRRAPRGAAIHDARRGEMTSNALVPFRAKTSSSRRSRRKAASTRPWAT